MALECEALALHYELSTSGLGLVLLGLDTVGLVNITAYIIISAGACHGLY